MRADPPRERRVILSPQQEAVLEAITRIQSTSGERSVITFRHIAAEAHLSYITVRRAVEALTRKGSLQKLVVRTDTSQGSVYTLTKN